MSSILKAENISKQYRLGLVGTGTISDDLKRWWYNVRGKEDPFLKVGAVNDRGAKAQEDYVWALKDINFEVKPGEVLGIIGKNGAGKSTLLKILSRVTSPTTGSIKTKGRIASLLEVGTGFHGELTGRENIYLNGAILGMTKPEINSKIDEIIDFSGCEMYIDTPVKRYSSGMTVRLGFAVAAHLEPEILVVDEVLAVGDVEFQKKAIGKMQDLSTGEGRTVLFVSHNMASVKSLCDRGILLKNGLILSEGKINSIVDMYLSDGTESDMIRPLERKDRGGNGKLRISDLQILNKKGETISNIISSEEINLIIEIRKFQYVSFKNLIISVAIQDIENNTVLLFSSDEMGFNFEDLEEKNNFRLKIPSLDLRGGEYSFRMVITEGSTNADNFIDVINNIAKLKVIPGDFYGVGKENRSLKQAIIKGEYEV